MKEETRKWLFNLLDKEVKELNMKTENARNKLIFSYNDVIQILDKCRTEMLEEVEKFKQNGKEAGK